MTPSQIEDMVGAARAGLQRVATLAADLSNSTFTSPCTVFGGSTIGQHVRHALDHYERFLAAAEDDGAIDYDARNRDTSIENSTAAATARAVELDDALARVLNDLDLRGSVSVSAACSTEGDCEPQSSSWGRELQFLVSHTVHHFAILKAMCNLRGVELEPDFGTAPSTLRHRDRC